MHLPEGRWRVFALFFLATLVLRAPWLGDPLFHTDEQFYLLVGDRLWQGVLPYVDLWDRKPLGLFLIYGAARAFPGDGVLAYQVMAIAAAAATATTITGMARRLTGQTGAGQTGAALAGLAYLLFLPVFNCGMGQAPVFYNLPMALAAAQVLGALADPTHLARRAALAMVLAGLAIQIKTSVVIEGAGFGLMLLWAGHRAGWTLPRLALSALAWIALALAPTGLAFAAYAGLGHGHDFIMANFVSIFGRGQDWGEAFERLAKIMAVLIPFYIGVALAARCRAASSVAPVIRRALWTWLAFAVVGFLAPGTWYDHYVAPVLMPLAILAAPALNGVTRGQRLARGFLLLVGAAAGFGATAAQAHKFGNRDDLDEATAMIRPHINARHCLYVYEGDSALYRATGSCLPTRYAFPAHLSTRFEDGALGVDSLAEVQRIMAAQPGAVMIDESGDPYAPNLRTREALVSMLAQGYHRIRVLTIGTRPFGLYVLH